MKGTSVVEASILKSLLSLNSTITVGASELNSSWDLISNIPSSGSLPSYTLGSVSLKGALANDSFAQQSIEPELIVYPNPAADVINLKLQNIIGATKIEIYSSTDQLVYAQAIKNESESINIDHLINGFYFIKINGTTPIVKRFIKE